MMVAPPAPGKVTSFPSMAGSSAFTDSGLRGGRRAGWEAAGLAAAEPDAAGLAEAEAAGLEAAAAEAAAEAAGLADADAAGLAEAAAEAAGLGAAELAGATLGAACPPQPISDRMDAAEATPPAI